MYIYIYRYIYIRHITNTSQPSCLGVNNKIYKKLIYIYIYIYIYPYDISPTPVNLPAWGLTTSDRCRACGKAASLKHILTGCEYALRSYTWRHKEVLEIFSEVSKVCCEIANKALNIINNRAIQIVKEGNISKIACKKMRKPSLLEGFTDWHIATDLKHKFIFEIALMTKRPDIVIWSIKPKNVFVIELMVPFEENFDWAHQRKLEKMRICVNNVSQMAG